MLRRFGFTFLLLLVLGGSAALAASSGPGEVGPTTRLQNNGRLLTHARAGLVALGNFPTGGALTSDGHFYWTVSTGRGFNDVRIVSTARRRVVQVIRVPGASGGIAIDSRHSVAYVSGVADSKHKDEQNPGLPGREGDNVRVYRYDRRSGRARFAGLLPVPAPPGTPKPQGLSDNTEVVAWPDRLAVAPNGRTLLVPLNLADQAAIVDVGSKRVRYVATGRFPYGAAITRDGRTGLVSNEVPGTVSAIDMRTGRKVKDLQVGGHLSHPEAIAVDPRAARAYVAIANSDEVAVIDTRRLAVERTLSVARTEGAGTSPIALTATPGGEQLLVAESGADEIAAFTLPVSPARRGQRKRTPRRRAPQPFGLTARAVGHPAPPPYRLIGRIPTAAYPADVAVDRARTVCRRALHGRRSCRRVAPTLIYLSAKGVGVGPNRHGSTPFATNDDNATSFQYLPLLVRGSAGIQPLPSARAIAGLTPSASAQLHPSNAQRAPAGTPLRAGGPIKHVFYIVRENRTYDQVLGDDGRGNGDPSLTLFGRTNTPNIHALVQRFPLLDHVFANSEASIDGHFVTSAAKVSDYVHKSWFQNYAARKRPYDFIDAVSWPQNRFLFDQAQRQNISYFNYGEAIAGTVPSVPGVAQTTDRDRDAADTEQVQQKFLNSDIQPPLNGGCYPNDASIGTDAILPNTETYDSSLPAGAPPNAESRFSCFQRRFTSQDASGTVPSFNYLVLPNDHTNGTTPGRRTPRAMVAENDYALGQIVDQISHSSVWKSSAIFVVEDDSQDGSDHIDAHRTVGAVISPFAKSGAVIHTRYDQLSLIRSLELILGMKPLGLFDNLATPMYDAFNPTPSNDAPYSALSPNFNLVERNGPAAPGAKVSRSFNLQQPDHIPQRTLDRLLWQSVHGAHSQPPPPGPNATPER